MERGRNESISTDGSDEIETFSRIESIGIKEPSGSLTTKDLVDSMKFKLPIDLEKLTGIHERKICMEGENSYTLGLGAIKDCLNHSEIDGKDIEMIIWCSISRSMGEDTIIYEPALSLMIKQEMGAYSAINFDISNACAGMMTGVYLVDDFIRKGIVKNGLVVSGEYISAISDNAKENVRTIASPQLASLTVGDVGAAVIIEKTKKGETGLKIGDFVTLSQYSKLCIGRPCKKRTGAIMKTKAKMIHRVAISDSPPIIDLSFRSTGMKPEEIDYMIPHQTSERSIMSGVRSMSKRWGVSPKNIVLNLKEYGNTASTTHFLALYKYLKEKRMQKGDNIMLISFASGLIIGIMFFTMDGLVDQYGS